MSQAPNKWWLRFGAAHVWHCFPTDQKDEEWSRKKVRIFWRNSWINDDTGICCKAGYTDLSH